MNPSYDGWQNITAELLMSVAPGEGQAEAGVLVFIFYATKVCYFWLGVCFTSTEEIPRKSLEKTGSVRDLCFPLRLGIRTAPCFTALKSVIRKNMPSWF